MYPCFVPTTLYGHAELAKLKREISEKKWAMGWMPDLQAEIRKARGRTARFYIPDQDGALHVRAVPPLDEEPAHPAVLVVPVPNSDAGAPLQGVPGVEGPTGDPVGGGVEGDWEVEEPVEDPGPPGR